jgi:hypothetical protein
VTGVNGDEPPCNASVTGSIAVSLGIVLRRWGHAGTAAVIPRTVWRVSAVSGSAAGYPADAGGNAWTSPSAVGWTAVVSVVVSGLLSSLAAVAEAVVADRAWNDCDPRIDASASVLTMLVIVLPLLLTVNALAVFIVVGLTWWATRSVRWRGLWICVMSTLAVVVLAYVWWVVWVTPAGDPDSICPGGAPPWAPRWLPS